MSGIDEQYRGIPKCPVCEEEPEYWILDTTIAGNGGGAFRSHITVKAWLFSEKHMNVVGRYYQYKHVGVGDKRFGIEVDKFIADYIISVEARCRCEKEHTTGRTFDEVKRATFYWLKKEGFGSEWDR